MMLDFLCFDPLLPHPMFCVGQKRHHKGFLCVSSPPLTPHYILSPSIWRVMIWFLWIPPSPIAWWYLLLIWDARMPAQSGQSSCRLLVSSDLLISKMGNAIFPAIISPNFGWGPVSPQSVWLFLNIRNKWNFKFFQVLSECPFILEKSFLRRQNQCPWGNHRDRPSGWSLRSRPTKWGLWRGTLDAYSSAPSLLYEDFVFAKLRFQPIA